MREFCFLTGSQNQGTLSHIRKCAGASVLSVESGLRNIVLALCAALATSGSASAAPDCSGLADMKIEVTNLLSAAEVPAAGDFPGYCRVLGYVRPAINFEVRLPLRDWNSKLYVAGCGGFCGALDADAPGFSDAMNYGLRRATLPLQWTRDIGARGTSTAAGRSPTLLRKLTGGSVP